MPFFPARIITVRWERRLGTREVHFAVRKRYLEEREVQLPELSPELEGVIASCPRKILNQIPLIVVLLRRQPVIRTDLAIAAQTDLRNASVQGGCRIISAYADLLVLHPYSRSLECAQLPVA